METRSSTLAGDLIIAEEPSWGWLLGQLKDESRTAADVVVDDALVQDDGIDLIVKELDRRWEVTKDQDKVSKIEKGPLRNTEGRQNGNDLHVLRGTEEA